MLFFGLVTHLAAQNAGGTITIGGLGELDGRSIYLCPHANWFSELVVMTRGRKVLFWGFRTILSPTSGTSILILRPPAALACPNYPEVTLPTTTSKTPNHVNWFRADCVHTGLSCNVGCFGIGCRDKPALVGGVAGVSFIKKPLAYGFGYSVRLLASAVTVWSLSKLDRKLHSCVKPKYLKHAI